MTASIIHKQLSAFIDKAKLEAIYNLKLMHLMNYQIQIKQN